MTDLVDEIKEDIKQERTMELLRQYGLILASCMVLIVLVSGGYVWHKDSQQQQYQELGSTLYTALRDSSQRNYDEAITKYDTLSQNKDQAISAIASYKKAQLFIQKKDYKQALAILFEIGNSEHAPKEIKELSLLHWSMIATSYPDLIDQGDVELVLTKLSTDNGVWRYSAKQQLAFYYFSHKRQEDARGLFNQLATEAGVPNTISQRAQQMVQVIGELSDGEV